MKEEIIELKFDASEARATVQGLADGLAALRTLAVDIGTAISNSFAPLREKLQSMMDNVLGLTNALTNATSALTHFTEVFVQAQTADQ